MCFWFFRMLIIIYIYRLEKYIRLVCTTRKNGIKFRFFFSDINGNYLCAFQWHAYSAKHTERWV